MEPGTVNKKTVKKRSVKKKAVKKKVSRSQEFSAGDICAAIDAAYEKFPKATRALVDALHGGSRNDVQVVLDLGFDVNSKLVGEITPIMFAAISSPMSVVKLLLERGADVTTCPILTIACTKASYFKALLNAGANPNAASHQTPLEYAIESREPDVVELLVKAGATIGKNELAAARQLAKSGDVRVLKILDPNQATDIRPTDGLTVERIVSAAPHVLKAAIPKVFEVTGVVPNLLKAPPPWIFSCPVDPNRFLTPQESKRTTAVSVAVRRAIEKLNGTLADCETAYCDMPLQPVLLVMQTKDKFLCEFRYKASL